MSKTPKAAGLGAFHGAGRSWTRECECGAIVTVTGECGPSNICDECAERLMAVVYGVPGAEFPPEYLFPLAQPVPVSCGLRADLPKKQRRHRPVYLGVDTRHMGDGGFEDVHVHACAESAAGTATAGPRHRQRTCS